MAWDLELALCNFVNPLHTAIWRSRILRISARHNIFIIVQKIGLTCGVEIFGHLAARGLFLHMRCYFFFIVALFPLPWYCLRSHGLSTHGSAAGQQSPKETVSDDDIPYACLVWRETDHEGTVASLRYLISLCL
ncbi:hypothetical protein BO86DRAFT_199290 [Aspergillus japonicus CBS 114.51]|uniref:Uncharacterized protein n=1 Tax=Aspergillus japonicus CBS 114.51 TaxID=1448312 RepID=A0A8T8WQL3_ASPJA|nr:hypothetical protein BO86DRAFT_199290 [Aspergillus japonicus CBS 114.51]RAH78061.1 hypothetical protein BO86DRAFT_199290 [Aspergillus japonicus CBS 114.51]